MATELFPNFAPMFRRVKDDGRAEAALIARYGAFQNIRNTMTGVDENEQAATVSDLQRHRAHHPAGGIDRIGNGTTHHSESWKEVSE